MADMKDTLLRDWLAAQPVLPIMTVRSVDVGLKMAESFLGGGLAVMEITLRTAEAPAAIQAIRQRYPEMRIGAGTLLRAEDFPRAEAAGARFAVSPGLDASLAEAGAKSALPFLPGVQTASEVMAAVGHGFQTLKFYPARAAGGPPVLADFAGVFPDVRFVPTGKIGQAEVPDYLALPNVLTVGGSWVAPPDRVAAGDWAAVRDLARVAVGLR
jgi:2-dehydro-3-deoxyphosphogluconate aldolase/(4S)-4-hydroxy-2-oxoglutarate aldolase